MMGRAALLSTVGLCRWFAEMDKADRLFHHENQQYVRGYSGESAGGDYANPA